MHNELHSLPASRRTRLLAQGATFACHLSTDSGKSIVLFGKRSPAAAANDIFRDALATRHSQLEHNGHIQYA